MSDAAPVVPWLAGLPPRPLCPVPWEGNTVVTSDGQVQLCCFSDAVVGNVNQQPFEAIWNGPQMQRIRRTLVAGALPPECRSGSCPFFRGDALHYLVDRRDGSFRDGAAAAVQAIAAQRLAGTQLRVVTAASRGGRLVADFFVAHAGEPAVADLFVCVVGPDGACRFLPDLVEHPQPFHAGLRLAGSRRLRVCDVAIDGAWLAGDWRLCAAFVVADADPNLANHCYWSTVVDAGSLAG